MEVEDSAEEGHQKRHGIEALCVDYRDMKAQVEKGKEIVDFEREGSCSLCHTELEHDAGIYAICPHPGCESVTHLACLSTEFLKGDEKGALVPIQGTCPECKKETRWVDVVKETSLRMRGQKEVEKLLRVKRREKGKGWSASQVVDEEEQWDLEDEMELDEEVFLRDLNRNKSGEGDSWNALDDDNDSDTGSITSTVSASQTKRDGECRAKTATGLDTVIEDSDWDDAEVLD
jgi:structure-specific endonuclease subunit SLX1